MNARAHGAPRIRLHAPGGLLQERGAVVRPADALDQEEDGVFCLAAALCQEEEGVFLLAAALCQEEDGVFLLDGALVRLNEVLVPVALALGHPPEVARRVGGGEGRDGEDGRHLVDVGLVHALHRVVRGVVEVEVRGGVLPEVEDGDPGGDEGDEVGAALDIVQAEAATPRGASSAAIARKVGADVGAPRKRVS
jgi:hypothetical protein